MKITTEQIETIKATSIGHTDNFFFTILAVRTQLEMRLGKGSIISIKPMGVQP